MRKPEAKYRYLLNKDKYDPEVTEAVDKKKLSEKDANTVSKIQEMMRKEREKRGTRNIVTSENREEFMAKKLKLGKKEGAESSAFDRKGNKVNVYIPSKDEDEEEESYAPVAPVPARKYIKGTPEHKEAKAKQKPINGMPTNRRK